MIKLRNQNGYGGITKLSGNRRRPWWVRITAGWDVTETGKPKQIYKTLGYFETRKKAMIALAEYNKNPFDINTNNITFSEVWDLWTPKHFEHYPKSAASLRSAYKKCEPLYKMKMVDIKKAHMQNILDSISHMSEESQTKVKTVFKATFRYCLENDILTKDYSQFLTIKQNKSKSKKSKYFTEDELALLFDNQDFTVEFPTGKKSYATLNLTYTVTLLLYTGVRITELLTLRVDDINIKDRTMLVRGTKSDNAERIVPIHTDIIPLLEKLTAASKSGFLIENANAKPIKYDPYKKHFFDPWMESLGLTHTPHATRHTFISRMDRVGVSSQSVVLKRIVGHSDSSVTETYTHKDILDLIGAIDKLKIM